MSYPLAANGEYDEKLLASAPRATRAQTQGGYDTSLLRNPSSVGYTPALEPEPEPVDVFAPNRPHIVHTPAPFQTFTESKPSLAEDIPAPVPWWRTRRWIMILAFVGVGVVIVVAATVGGVEGHRHQTAASSHDSTTLANGTSALASTASALGLTDTPVVPLATVATGDSTVVSSGQISSDGLADSSPAFPSATGSSSTSQTFGAQSSAVSSSDSATGPSSTSQTFAAQSSAVSSSDSVTDSPISISNSGSPTGSASASSSSVVHSGASELSSLFSSVLSSLPTQRSLGRPPPPLNKL